MADSEKNKDEFEVVNGIRWPSHFSPNADPKPIIVTNTLDRDHPIKAPVKIVWDCLLRAKEWPNWYEDNSDNVEFTDDNPSELLDKGRTFKWDTFSLRINCKVEECFVNDQAEICRIGWSGVFESIAGINQKFCFFENDFHKEILDSVNLFKLEVYHTWLITQIDETSCHVLTEESQHGVFANAQDKFLPNRMKEGHDYWLEQLKIRAESIYHAKYS